MCSWCIPGSIYYCPYCLLDFGYVLNVYEQLHTTRMCADVVERLPKCWQGLFGALRCPLESDCLQVAEQWLQQKYYSQLENVPQWEILLSGLTQNEPQHHAPALTFKPLFCLLPCHLQIKLLAVIFHHRQQICVSSLEEFLGTIKIYVQGTWQNTLYSMLTHFIAEQSKQRTGDGLMLANYNFTQVNTALNQQVYDVVSTAHIISPLQSSVDVAAADTDAYKVNKKDMVTSSPDEKEGEETPELFDDRIADKESMEEAVIIVHEDSSMDTPPSKKVKQHVDESVEVTNGASEVDTAVLNKAEWLRELWQSSSFPNLEPLELNFLSTLPASRMKLLCGVVNISSLPDESLALAFELLTQMKYALSYSSCVEFISGCFLPKFNELDQTASKSLTDVFMNLGQTFPKQLIDSITADSRISNMTSSQSDILCRLCKEIFNAECQAYMLRKLLSSSGVLTEHCILVVSCLLEKLDKLDETTTAIVFHCINKSAHDLCQSLKFGKLIFSFVNKYGNTWSAAQLSLLFQVTDIHKTFMKKSVLAALRRISK